MKIIYTCYTCGFPFSIEEENIPDACPICSAPRSQFLIEPFMGSIEKRRIHVDPPKQSPVRRDPYDITYHRPRIFREKSLHGRIRRFVAYYDDLEATKEYYDKVFGWDIIPVCEDRDKERPLMYCATGPGLPNWEPKYASFEFGFLKPRETDTTGREPNYIVEVDSIDELVAKLPEYGGKVIKGKYTVDGNEYAVIEDSEENALIIWQTPADLDWDAPENGNLWEWRRHQQTLDDIPVSPYGVPEYPGRPPKKYPKKSLHGRVRFGTIYYRDFRTFQKFYTDLFGWDMFELPVAGGGKELGSDQPDVIIATGPSYETYEGLVPGFINVFGKKKTKERDKAVFLMEIEMDEPVSVTGDMVKRYGGTVISEIPEPDIPGASMHITYTDPSGNVWDGWRCPDTRTWDEAETFYDMDAEDVDK